MDVSLYIAMLGAKEREDKLSVFAENVANAVTPGFKRELVSFVQRGVAAQPKVVTDLSPGRIRHTGNPLDIAIKGDGFFVVKTPKGVAYTRRGDFAVDGSGMLVTKDGYQVLGLKGPIHIKGGKVSVSSDGRIYVDGNFVDKLRLVSFPKGLNPIRLSGTLFTLPPGVKPSPSSRSIVLEGYLEGSNVNPVKEMVALVGVMRAYETAQKVIVSSDQMTGKAVNELGAVRA